MSEIESTLNKKGLSVVKLLIYKSKTAKSRKALIVRKVAILLSEVQLKSVK